MGSSSRWSEERGGDSISKFPWALLLGTVYVPTIFIQESRVILRVGRVSCSVPLSLYLSATDQFAASIFFVNSENQSFTNIQLTSHTSFCNCYFGIFLSFYRCLPRYPMNTIASNSRSARVAFGAYTHHACLIAVGTRVHDRSRKSQP